MLRKQVIYLKRSVYSLVLMDDVIKAVDEEAYRQGTSRSNLINQILAQHLSYTTPEMRIRNIFDSVSDSLDSYFQLIPQNSGSLMTIKTALQYRYNPTINYKVELLRSPDNYLGSLKVQIRTQSQNLIDLFCGFFKLWTSFEIICLGDKMPSDYSAEINSNKFSRKLYNPLKTSKINENYLGEKIYKYINFLDSSIKLYLSDTESFRSQENNMKFYYNSLMSDFII